MNPMSPAELRVAIATLGLTQEGLSEILHIHERTIRKYLSGTSVINNPTAMLIRIMVARRNWNDLITIGYGGQ